jgi:hypothetical protein
MSRWLVVLSLVTFALQSTAALTVLAADVCVETAATSSAAHEDDGCPPVCLRCACCGRLAPTVIRLAYEVSEPHPAPARDSDRQQRVLTPEPRAILHVPLLISA